MENIEGILEKYDRLKQLEAGGTSGENELSELLELRSWLEKREE